MDKETKIIAGVVMACLLLAIGVTFGVRAWSTRFGVCVCNKPIEVVGGTIWSDGEGLFSGGFEAFRVVHAGTYKESGGACKKRHRVTQREYERQMYSE